MQVEGVVAVRAALEAGDLRLLLHDRDEEDEMILELIELVRRQGIPCTATATSDLRRMGPSRPTVRVLGLTGRDPTLGLEAMLAAPGTIVWLANVRYPPNLGAAMRTTEVSGASGMIISGTSSMRERKTAVRSAVRADRFIPVHWLLHEEAVTAIRASGRRVVAIEDVGTLAPWESDLVDAVLVVGAEFEGVPEDVLEMAHEIVRIPMEGFVPSYNLHAALAVVVVEAMRQRRGP